MPCNYLFKIYPYMKYIIHEYLSFELHFYLWLIFIIKISLVAYFVIKFAKSQKIALTILVLTINIKEKNMFEMLYSYLFSHEIG